MLLAAKDDLRAFTAFLERHWKKIQSTNPLERINREVKRRADVVQVLWNDEALPRLVAAVLFELHDEWRSPVATYPREPWTSSSPAEFPESAPRATPTRRRVDRPHHFPGRNRASRLTATP
ncbi:hypothetical protein GCM10018790_00660 [Kitasatospora xanthocidica]|uniref:transposase n=1 Tax=Kitasatospora xanthocidica TaxID=83382 RepID=UPI00167326C2|nr:transposase [Kitasatospora xanthocidica]GHF27264.1 hypothetical protein GCM10018790_00660 [Kitasatospora xanthocidica]